MADPSSTAIIPVDSDSLAINGTSATPTPVPTEFLAQLLFFGNKLYPLLPTYAHLLVVALLPIYAGAHASLARPNNVRPSKKKKDEEGSEEGNKKEGFDDKGRSKRRSPQLESDDEGEDEDEEEDEIQPVENLTSKDALLFPITAGLMLGLLYVIIKYLKDPTLLSRILTYYFALMGTVSVGAFCADVLGVLVQVVFPRRWRHKKNGVEGVYVAGHNQYHFHDKLVGGNIVPEKEESNPFPRGFLPVPKALYKPIWALRRKLLAKWAVVIKLGKGPSKADVIRKTFWVGDLVGLVCGLGCVLGYVFTGKHWIASNLMGVSFAYSAMRLISPTTFSTATLLLSLLFFYDIYFVFYTPLMVTVATNLDVPIKLLFPRPAPDSAGPDARPALAMLGLGDVVLPGMMIGMALRFDFWRWNEGRKKFYKSTDVTVSETKSEVKREILPRYIKATGTWGERLWNPSTSNSTVVGGTFPKTYFYTSIVGYIIGMVATLLVMHVWNHAQPALLYLVPGVVGMVWGAGFVRGELKLMWNYTEEDPEKEKEEKEREEKEKEQMREAGDRARKLVEEKEKEKTATTAFTPAHDIEIPNTTVTKAATSQNPDTTSTKDKEHELSTEDKDNSEEKSLDVVDDIELVNEQGETEYLTVSVVKRPAFGAATKTEAKKENK